MIVLSLIFLFFLILILLFCRKQISKKTKAILLITYILSFFINLLLLKIKFFNYLLFLILVTFLIIWHEIKKKTKKDILITSSIILIFIVSLYTFSPRLIYYKFLYLDDRVKITTSVYVDGEKMDIDEDFVTISGKGIGKKRISSGDDGIKISFKGNEYENYHINIKIEDYHNDYYIDLLLQHWNWWDINRIDVVINIDTKENTISYSVENRFISEEKNYTEDLLTLSDTKELSTINKLFLG